ncbi:hypothetical protein BJF78_34695 [Pseudonocardia sp. CNS-139]|nr:hypothetical protein BJF78_34695 [Pseudonocardia sp. CNS-139]
MSTAAATDADLVEQVRALAVERSEWPSQSDVMRAFRVPAPRAGAALFQLRRAGFTPPDKPPDRPPEPPPITLVEPAADMEQQDARTVPGPEQHPAPARRVARWPLVLIALGAFVAIWSGWVELGRLTGFGPVELLPGIADGWTINTAVVLPLGVEAYATFALRAWLTTAPVSPRARTFARRSAIGALILGGAGQIAYHLMAAADVTVAPWGVTAFVSCLPVVVLGCGAALAHLLQDDVTTENES